MERSVYPRSVDCGVYPRSVDCGVYYQGQGPWIVVYTIKVRGLWCILSWSEDFDVYYQGPWIVVYTILAPLVAEQNIFGPAKLIKNAAYPSEVKAAPETTTSCPPKV